MQFAKKVIVAVELSDNLPELIKPLRDMEILNHCEIHFVHVFNTITYVFGLGEYPLVFPIPADRKIIEESALSLLRLATKNALPRGFEGKIVHRVLFHDDPKNCFSKYVNKESANLVIVPTRQKHGLFESSFAQYVNKHTSCNMIFLKTKSLMEVHDALRN